MKCFLAKPQEVEHEWLLVDATDLVLGRMAARVAALLRGKHKPIFTPNVDTGDCVIVINASKIRLTADKMNTKVKYHHSGHPGGFKQATFGRLMEKDAAEAVRQVIKGMVPHTTLGRQIMRKLKVYAGTTHPHEAQKPTDITETLRREQSRYQGE